MENAKFDLLIRCAGSETLCFVDLSREDDSCEIVQSLYDAVIALLLSRGRSLNLSKEVGPFALKFRKKEDTDDANEV